MMRVELRALVAGYLALAVLLVGWAALYFAHFSLLCDGLGPAEQVRGLEATSVVPVVGYARARDDEAIALCRSRHCLGWSTLSVSCHEDLGCYCVPAGLPPDEIAHRVMGGAPSSCRVVSPHPNDDDTAPPCPRSRCRRHVE